MTKMRNKLSHLPWALIAVMLAIIAYGVIFVFSASYRVQESDFTADPYKQVIWIAIGVGIFILLLVPNYMKFGNLAYFVYGIFLASILLSYLFPPVNGVRRWISFGSSFKLQPSEFMKIAVVLALAKYLMYRDNLSRVRKLAVPFCLALVPTVLILKQPDLGTALLFMPILFTLLYVAGARMRHLVLAAVIGLATLPPLYFFGLKEYQQKRFTGFLHPEQTSLQEGYQLVQSKIAIGSGGFTGQGLGKGSQNWMEVLPYDQTDFVFAVVGEEWGFAGACGLLLLYLGLFALTISVALRTREPFGRLIVAGVAGLLAAQVYINVGMTMGLMPITGMTLPLVSYGGSSMLSSFILLGLVANVSMHHIPVFSSKGFSP